MEDFLDSENWCLAFIKFKSDEFDTLVDQLLEKNDEYFKKMVARASIDLVAQLIVPYHDFFQDKSHIILKKNILLSATTKNDAKNNEKDKMESDGKFPFIKQLATKKWLLNSVGNLVSVKDAWVCDLNTYPSMLLVAKEGRNTTTATLADHVNKKVASVERRTVCISENFCPLHNVLKSNYTMTSLHKYENSALEEEMYYHSERGINVSMTSSTSTTFLREMPNFYLPFVFHAGVSNLQKTWSELNIVKKPTAKILVDILATLAQAANMEKREIYCGCNMSDFSSTKKYQMTSTDRDDVVRLSIADMSNFYYRLFCVLRDENICITARKRLCDGGALSDDDSSDDDDDDDDDDESNTDEKKEKLKDQRVKPTNQELIECDSKNNLISSSKKLVIDPKNYLETQPWIFIPDHPQHEVYKKFGYEGGCFWKRFAFNKRGCNASLPGRFYRLDQLFFQDHNTGPFPFFDSYSQRCSDALCAMVQACSGGLRLFAHYYWGPKTILPASLEDKFKPTEIQKTLHRWLEDMGVRKKIDWIELRTTLKGVAQVVTLIISAFSTSLSMKLTPNSILAKIKTKIGTVMESGESLFSDKIPGLETLLTASLLEYMGSCPHGNFVFIAQCNLIAVIETIFSMLISDITKDLTKNEEREEYEEMEKAMMNNPASNRYINLLIPPASPTNRSNTNEFMQHIVEKTDVNNCNNDKTDSIFQRDALNRILDCLKKSDNKNQKHTTPLLGQILCKLVSDKYSTHETHVRQKLVSNTDKSMEIIQYEGNIEESQKILDKILVEIRKKSKTVKDFWIDMCHKNVVNFIPTIEENTWENLKRVFLPPLNGKQSSSFGVGGGNWFQNYYYRNQSMNIMTHTFDMSKLFELGNIKSIKKNSCNDFVNSFLLKRIVKLPSAYNAHEKSQICPVSCRSSDWLISSTYTLFGVSPMIIIPRLRLIHHIQYMERYDNNTRDLHVHPFKKRKKRYINPIEQISSDLSHKQITASMKPQMHCARLMFLYIIRIIIASLVVEELQIQKEKKEKSPFCQFFESFWLELNSYVRLIQIDEIREEKNIDLQPTKEENIEDIQPTKIISSPINDQQHTSGDTKQISQSGPSKNKIPSSCTIFKKKSYRIQVVPELVALVERNKLTDNEFEEIRKTENIILHQQLLYHEKSLTENVEKRTVEENVERSSSFFRTFYPQHMEISSSKKYKKDGYLFTLCNDFGHFVCVCVCGWEGSL